MANKINIGSIGLLVMVLSFSVVEAYELANCTDGDISNVDKCSCPEGEVMADISNTGFRCYSRDNECSKDEFYNTDDKDFQFCVCFEFAKEDIDCVSICGSCENGWCSSPKKCVCNPGFAMTSEGKCEPVCANGCQNGTCVGPEQCSCNEGYSMSKANTCEPVCANGCQNGICISPENCNCNKGYFLSYTNKCQPICADGCENGSCLAPGKCSCNEGYSMSTANKCVPVCENGCENGVCVSPGNCSQI